MKKIIVAVAALALLAGSAAYAAEWNFYGNARILTTWYDRDVIDGADGDWQYGESLAGTSRIGANVKVSDELSGRFEYGTGVNVRHLYGEWNFGGGSLIVGQTDSPFNICYSSQIALADSGWTENGLGGFGDCDTGRSPEIMLTFGGFQIAVINPDTTTGLAGATKTVIPEIDMSYTLGFDMGEVKFGAGYSTFEVGDEDVTSYVLGIGTSLNFGPVNVFGTGVYGQNAGQIIFIGTGSAGYAGATATGEVNDVETMGFTIGAVFTINDMFAIEAGYGYVVDEYDEGGAKDKGQSYYIQAPITLAPGVVVTPEVGVIDGKDTGDNEWTYVGAKWQINF